MKNDEMYKKFKKILASIFILNIVDMEAFYVCLFMQRDYRFAGP